MGHQVHRAKACPSRHGRHARIGLSLIALSASLAVVPTHSVAQTAAPSASSDDRLVIRAPGARPAPQSTEEGIWTISADAEREARLSPSLMDDATLYAYVREVQCKVARDYCDDLRLGIYRRPALNATVMPNGYTEVWTGLLLRAENEAQLAFVLGHEFAHFRGNHSLREFESLRTTAGALLALRIVIGAAGGFDPNYTDYSQYADILSAAAYLGSVASMFAYSREFEREADTVGQQLMVEAGYAPDQASAIWTTVLDLQSASDNLETRRAATRGGIFRTHPITTERMSDLTANATVLAANATGPLTVDAERHRAMIRPFLNDWLRDEIRRRDYGATLALVARLRAGGDAGMMTFYEGEAYRLRRGPGDDFKAVVAYQAATAFADAPTETWRELGNVLLRLGDPVGATSALNTYLQRAPNASDAPLVRRILERHQNQTTPPTPLTTTPAGGAS